ncbi:MAG: hypothetical protein K0U78_13510 [Actinomycetia bacterium]|nr:hypothetical protein [Actinomycetes bacterium]
MTSQTYNLDGPKEFPFPHPVRSADQLTVEIVPGAAVAPGDYEVVGVGPTSTQVTVRYPNAPTSGGLQLKITRYVAPERVTQIDSPSDINVTNLNAEFNNVYEALTDFESYILDLVQTEVDAAIAAKEAAQLAAQEAEAAWDAFRDQYWGAYAADPSVSPIGNPPDEGDLYWNTTANQWRVWNGTAWQQPDTAVGVNYDRQDYIATASQTTFAVDYDAPFVQVWVNGALIPPSDYTAVSGTDVVLDEGVPADTEVTVIGLGATAIDVLDGDAATVTTSTGTQLLPAALNDRVLHVPDIAALRALTGVQDGQAVYLEADSSGGAGTYVIDTGSAAPESLPNIIVLNDGSRAVKERTGFLHAKSGKRYQIVDCVIRQTAPGEGWEFIDDAGHSPTGVSSIAVDGSGNLLLGFSFTAAKVGSLVAVPDEFYAAQGMIIGASVGVSTATIKGVADMSALVTPISVAFTGSLGFADDVTVDHDAASGAVSFTHAPTYAFGNSTGQSISVEMVDVAGNHAGGGVTINDLTASGFVVQRITPCAGAVTMLSGAASVSSLGAGVSASWNATDTCVDVVHPEAVSLDNTPVVGPMIRNPDTDTPYTYLAEFTSSATTIKVHVYTPDGTKITDPLNNSIRFSFYRPNLLLNRPLSSADGTRFAVLRKNVPLNFDNVFANSGNIWIHGVFEVSD